MKVALVHDWLNQMGGAENVLEELVGLFPEAPVYTSMYAPHKMPDAYRAWPIHTSFMQRLPGVTSHHQAYLPLYPLAFGRTDLSRYDLVRRANTAKTFPGSDPPVSTDPPDLPDVEGSNAAKTFAGPDANPAKTFPGSGPRPRFTAALYRTAIAEKLDAGLSLQRIWQDLVEEYGYSASYESVKRFVRTLAPARRAVGVFHCAPGADYGESPVMVSSPAFSGRPSARRALRA